MHARTPSSSSSTMESSETPLCPRVDDSNPDEVSPFLSSSSSSSPLPPSTTTPSDPPDGSLYHSVDADEEDATENAPLLGPPPAEETLVRLPGAILHLIDASYSVELGAGDFSLVRLWQGDSTVAVLARVGDGLVQWPLARDEAVVKLDESHYFFSLHVPPSSSDDGGDPGDGDVLNYGLTFASIKGQEALLEKLDSTLEAYSGFSVHEVDLKGQDRGEVMDVSVAKELTPEEAMGEKKEMMEERSAAYWTTLAPNVEDYSSTAAQMIAKGSGQLIKGILWCGDVTVDRLKWGEELLKSKLGANFEQSEISEYAMTRMRRVTTVTVMTEKAAVGILSGVVKVSGFFTSSLVNSRLGKMILRLVPGEILLASLDGFGKICDAVEVAGKNVLETSSTVTTGVVSHKYGEQAAEITREGMGAAGHAFGTAWAVFNIRKALSPKPTALAKAAATAGDLKEKLAKE